MSRPNDHPRVPPSDGGNELLHDYGRQLAVDSLLELLLTDRTFAANRPRPEICSGRLARQLVALAVAVSLLLIFVISIPRDKRPPLVQENILAAAWRIKPTGAAEYRILEPARIRLDRGELRIYSTANTPGKKTPPILTIETPAGKAVASDTDFFIGTYSPQTKFQGETMHAPLTRILVLSGAVTLANVLGSVSGGPQSLLAAEPGKPPAQIAVTANSEFGLDLYRQIARQSPDKNVFFSPYSLSSALAMAAEGARGETAAEMGKTLRFPEIARRIGDDAQLLPWNTAMIHMGMAELNRRFNTKDQADPAVLKRIGQLRKELAETKKHSADLKKERQYGEMWNVVEKGNQIAGELNRLLAQVNQYELRVANGLWGDKGHPFQKEFLETLSSHYATGGIALMDFQNNPEAARKEINQWCLEQTKGRIADALPKSSIDKDTRLVLANAIYFLGQWSVPFNGNLTQDADFLLGGKETVRTPMMHKPFAKAVYAAFNADGTFFETPAMYNPKDPNESKLYPGDGGFLMAEFPYKGGQIAMTVIVPRSTKALNDVESKLTSDNLRRWIGRLQGRQVRVFLPKFKMQTTYEMSDLLKALGMNRAFDAKGADFSGISSDGEPLYMSAVFHKAFVEVNEKGTEAAAFTGIPMPKSAGGPSELLPFIPTFKADKPFLFVIRDCKSGTILFLGRVTNPTAG
jgi:serine protease inhibitor